LRDTEVPTDDSQEVPNKVLGTCKRTIKNQIKIKLGLKNSAAQKISQQE